MTIKPEDESGMTGAEYALYCLKTIQDLTEKQCDLLYEAATEKSFDYGEVKAMLFDKDGILRNDEEMEEQYERILHRREQAEKLSKMILDNHSVK